MVAVYFAAFPDEARKYKIELDVYYEEEEEREAELDDMRTLKLKSILFPASVLIAAKVSKNEKIKQQAMDECIPEFRRFNIIESEIRNVI